MSRPHAKPVGPACSSRGVTTPGQARHTLLLAPSDRRRVNRPRLHHPHASRQARVAPSASLPGTRAGWVMTCATSRTAAFSRMMNSHGFMIPLPKSMGTDPTNGLSAAKDIFERAGLGDRWALFSAQSSQWVGPAQNNVAEFLATADIVLNVSAANPFCADRLHRFRCERSSIPTRCFLRCAFSPDPIRPRPGASAQRYFFTLGENIASGRCSVVRPNSLSWQSVRQPIVLDKWQVTEGSRQSPFTTLMAWDSFHA